MVKLRYNKGQTEIIGLIVIVILLILGGLIYLRLQTGNSRDYGELRTNVKAANLLQAMTLITLEGKQLKDHLVICKQTGDCSILERELPKIIERSLQSNQDYLLVIMQGQDELLRLGNCTTGIASTFPVIRQGISFDMQLKICQKE